MSALIIAEHDNKELKPVTLHAVTAASEWGSDLHVLVVGSDCQEVAQQAAKIAGVAKVLLVDNASYEHQLAEDVAPLVADIGKSYGMIAAGATTFGKNLMPRIGALLDVQPLSDVLKVISEDTFQRPIYAGNIVATVQSSDPIKVLTIRATAFEAAAADTGTASVESLPAAESTGLAEFVKEELAQSDRPELTAANVVISGGRGLQSGENFDLLYQLADKLQGAVGASRAAVDAGFVPNDMQVGQTGKVVAPDLYIAVGISGAIQHLAGMKDSKVIVAINKDGDAPIFQSADYGLVADLFEVIPELTAKISN